MKTIGRYEVVGELGRGGWGVVYRAIDPGLGRTVAIKIIHASNDAKEVRERFHREARTAGMLSHPNIVTVYEFSDTGDVMFIAMEYVDGQTLAQKMQDGALPLDFTLAIVRAASEALDFAHAHNIVHRDVKPGNFIISRDGHLKMADFGIAKILDSEVGLTSTGMVIGTAQYMSPEQIAAKEVTGRSDQFSLAVIAYEMLTGHRPFHGNSWASMMHAIISSEPPALNEYRRELGDEATQVLRKGLAKDPLQRYPTCRSMVDALDHALLGPTAERPSYPAVPGQLPITAQREYRAETPARPKTSSSAAGPLSEQTETMFLPTPSARPGATSEAASATATSVLPPPNGSSTAAQSRRKWTVMAGVATVVVLGLGSWFIVRDKHQATTQEHASSVPANIGPMPQVSAPSLSAPNTSEPLAGLGSVPPAADTTAPPSANLPNPPPASAASAPSISPNPPAIVPAPAPNRAKQDQARRVAEEQAKRLAEQQAKTAAEEQAKRIADEQAKRLAEQQAKTAAEAQAKRAADEQAKRVAEQQAKIATEEQVRRAADEQAKRLAEQQAKNAAEARAKRTADEQAKRVADEQAKTAAEEKIRSAHTTELQSVARALANYKSAYESKDVAALQEIWPSISKSALDDIRGSFRDASDVKIDIHPVGDPEIAGDTATVVCDRDLRQTIRKKMFQASSRVRIALNRKGAGWVIASIDTVK